MHRIVHCWFDPVRVDGRLGRAPEQQIRGEESDGHDDARCQQQSGILKVHWRHSNDEMGGNQLGLPLAMNGAAVTCTREIVAAAGL